MRPKGIDPVPSLMQDLEDAERERDKALAKVERLRLGLAAIVQHDPGDDPWWGDAYDTLKQIARDALTAEDQPGGTDGDA